jgi:pyridoxine kinase
MNKAKNKTIIIHSKVSYGYVGSSTTALVLQMGGFDVLTVPTVLYSNRLGYPTVGGGIVPEDLFAGVLEGILKLDIADEISTVITGFIGSVKQIEITAAFITRIKQANPAIRFLCDPVMGDTDKGLYVPGDIPAALIKHLIPLADMLTPNPFEMERITGIAVDPEKNTIQTWKDSFDLARQTIVLTGGHTTEKNSIDIYVIKNNQCDIIKSKKINIHPPGTGELFTAHLQLSMLLGQPLNEAALLSGDILSAVLQKMLQENRKEFDLADILFSMHREHI